MKHAIALLISLTLFCGCKKEDRSRVVLYEVLGHGAIINCRDAGGTIHNLAFIDQRAQFTCTMEKGDYMWIRGEGVDHFASFVVKISVDGTSFKHTAGSGEQVVVVDGTAP